MLRATFIPGPAKGERYLVPVLAQERYSVPLQVVECFGLLESYTMLRVCFSLAIRRGRLQLRNHVCFHMIEKLKQETKSDWELIATHWNCRPRTGLHRARKMAANK